MCTQPAKKGRGTKLHFPDAESFWSGPISKLSHLYSFLPPDASQSTIRQNSLAEGAGKSPGQVTEVGLLSFHGIFFTHPAQNGEESGSLLLVHAHLQPSVS